MNPNSSVYDNPQLGEARNAASSAATAANTAQATQASLPDMLKEALTKKFSMNNPQVANRESLAGNLLNTTTQAPLDYTAKSAGGNSDVVYNPLQQANLINQRHTSALSPLLSANYLLDLSSGGIQNVIDSTSRAHQGLVGQLQGEADIKRNSYQDLLAELQGRAQEQAAQAQAHQKNTDVVEANGHKYLIDKTTGEKIADLGTSGSGGSGIGGLGDISTLLQQMGIGNNGNNSPWEIVSPDINNILDYNKYRDQQNGVTQK